MFIYTKQHRAISVKALCKTKLIWWTVSWLSNLFMKTAVCVTQWHLSSKIIACIGKLAASVQLKMFINSNERCHTTGADKRMSGSLFSNVNNIHFMILAVQKKTTDNVVRQWWLFKWTAFVQSGSCYYKVFVVLRLYGVTLHCLRDAQLQ